MTSLHKDTQVQPAAVTLLPLLSFQLHFHIQKFKERNGEEIYFVLCFVNPLLHQVSSVFSCATVLRDVGVLYVRRVFGEHVLPSPAHDHLEKRQQQNKKVAIFLI